MHFNKYLWFTIAIIVFFVALRIPFLNKEYVFEETFLVKSGESIAATGYPEYYVGEQFEGPTVNLLKPPLFVMSLAAMYTLFGSSEITSRLVPLLYNLGTLLLLMAFARRFFACPPGQSPSEVGQGENGRAIGYVAGFLFSIHPFFIQNSIQVDLDGGIVSFFAMLFIYVCATQLSSNAPTFKTWLIVGSVFLLQFATKFEPALMVAFAVFLWLIVTRKSLRTIVWYCVTLFTAVSAFFLLFHAYNASFGHPEQTLMPLLVITHIFDAFFLPRFSGAIIDVHQLKAWQESAALASMYIVWLTPAFLLTVSLLIIRRFRSIIRQPILLLLFLWFAVMAITYLVFGNTGPGYPRYFAPVTIPLFLLISYFLADPLHAVVSRKAGLLRYGGVFILFTLLFFIWPKLLFLDRKLLINLKLLQDRTLLYSVMILVAVWILLFAVFLLASYRKKIGTEQILLFALIGFFSTMLFTYVHDVRADYSLTNVYGQSGFRESARYLKEVMPAKDNVLTDDSTGYYYGAPYFDLAFSLDSTGPAYGVLVRALFEKKIAAIAISEKQLAEFLKNPRLAVYLKEFQLDKNIGTRLIFQRATR